jgi:hypothetical protein
VLSEVTAACANLPNISIVADKNTYNVREFRRNTRDVVTICEKRSAFLA